ncbi:hypothetical protein FGG08_000671 [Glutinoglossum americanum]|uniref:Nitrogen regulatory protein areA GATA-like domain-containing protein n=1 Tax=Glutinoglossum americanum TaxID=1670608 RepID=A0A9P8L6Q1_9PEZI|nr:hypothetical protein FGG08_000671 [Glutinoglossum americanum]
MSPRLASPVLTVDARKIAKVDPRNVENLFGMWTVFSKCAESLEEGRRLENLSWRLWNRETFCCEQEDYPAAQRLQKKSRRDHDDMPELSASVDSAASDEIEQLENHTQQSISGAVDIRRPPLPRRDSAEPRSRGKEKHITSLHLERMVMTIKEKKDLEPFSPRRSTAPARTTEVTDTTPKPASTPNAPKVSLPPSSSESESAASQYVSSESSATSDALSSHSIVRGFSPGHISSSYRSHTRLAPTVVLKAQIPVEVNKKKTGTMFMLGASSGEEESSLEEHMSTKFHLQTRSSLSEGLKRPQRKRTSFKDDVSTRTVYEGTHEDDGPDTDDDEEVVSESAIDDDDSSDWEDSVTESGRSSVNEKEMFQRVDSRPNLTSRRSLLSTLLHQPDRAAALQNAASRSTPAMRSRTSSPNGPSVSASPEEESALTMRGPQIPRSRPIIMTTSSVHPPTLSPRTTRRNMLATELTESLRRHLLWERQQKNTTASAVLKRRHTSHDVTNLQEYPGQISKDASKNNSWNYFDHGLGEYHQKGW